jgi:AAA+ superfamily predicted ATPase
LDARKKGYYWDWCLKKTDVYLKGWLSIVGITGLLSIDVYFYNKANGYKNNEEEKTDDNEMEKRIQAMDNFREENKEITLKWEKWPPEIIASDRCTYQSLFTETDMLKCDKPQQDFYNKLKGIYDETKFDGLLQDALITRSRERDLGSLEEEMIKNGKVRMDMMSADIDRQRDPFGNLPTNFPPDYLRNIQPGKKVLFKQHFEGGKTETIKILRTDERFVLYSFVRNDKLNIQVAHKKFFKNIPSEGGFVNINFEMLEGTIQDPWGKKGIITDARRSFLKQLLFHKEGLASHMYHHEQYAKWSDGGWAGSRVSDWSNAFDGFALKEDMIKAADKAIGRGMHVKFTDFTGGVAGGVIVSIHVNVRNSDGGWEDKEIKLNNSWSILNSNTLNMTDIMGVWTTPDERQALNLSTTSGEQLRLPHFVTEDYFESKIVFAKDDANKHRPNFQKHIENSMHILDVFKEEMPLKGEMGQVLTEIGKEAIKFMKLKMKRTKINPETKKRLDEYGMKRKEVAALHDGQRKEKEVGKEDLKIKEFEFKRLRVNEILLRPNTGAVDTIINSQSFKNNDASRGLGPFLSAQIGEETDLQTTHANSSMNFTLSSWITDMRNRKEKLWNEISDTEKEQRVESLLKDAFAQAMDIAANELSNPYQTFIDQMWSLASIYHYTPTEIGSDYSRIVYKLPSGWGGPRRGIRNRQLSRVAAKEGDELWTVAVKGEEDSIVVRKSECELLGPYELPLVGIEWLWFKLPVSVQKDLFNEVWEYLKQKWAYIVVGGLVGAYAIPVLASAADSLAAKCWPGWSEDHFIRKQLRNMAGKNGAIDDEKALTTDVKKKENKWSSVGWAGFGIGLTAAGMGAIAHFRPGLITKFITGRKTNIVPVLEYYKRRGEFVDNLKRKMDAVMEKNATFVNHLNVVKLLDDFFCDRIGQLAVKKQFLGFYLNILQNENVTDEAKSTLPLNFLFLGNPGTGKTTAADKLANILFEVGLRQRKLVLDETELKRPTPEDVRKKLGEDTAAFSNMIGVAATLHHGSIDDTGDFSSAFAGVGMSMWKRLQQVNSFEPSDYDTFNTAVKDWNTYENQFFDQIFKPVTHSTQKVMTSPSKLMLKDKPAAAFEQDVQGLNKKGGGVLSMDEAYGLDPFHNPAGAQIYGQLLLDSENYKKQITFILIGYQQDIENNLMAYNPGLARRFPTTMFFEDMSDADIRNALAIMLIKSRSCKSCAKRVSGWFMNENTTNLFVKKIAKQRNRKGFGNYESVAQLYNITVASAAKRNGIDVVQQTNVPRDEHVRVTAAATVTLQARAFEPPGPQFTTSSAELTEWFEIKIEDIIGVQPSKNVKLLDILVKKLGARQEDGTYVGGKYFGMKNIKDQIYELFDAAEFNWVQQKAGYDSTPIMLNKLFIGKPGTGKTELAKVWGQVLKELHLLTDGSFVEKASSDFVGNVVGDSQVKTSSILKAAEGKVLFIDEAYVLARNDFGQEAIDTIVEQVQATPGADRAVIMAGYEKEMLQMCRDQNPGLGRRFDSDHPVVFEDYGKSELGEIMELKAKELNCILLKLAKDYALDKIEMKRPAKDFGNAGTINNFLNNAVKHAQGRAMKKKRIRDNALSYLPPGEQFDWEFKEDLIINNLDHDTRLKYETEVKTLIQSVLEYEEHRNKTEEIERKHWRGKREINIRYANLESEITNFRVNFDKQRRKVIETLKREEELREAFCNQLMGDVALEQFTVKMVSEKHVSVTEKISALESMLKTYDASVEKVFSWHMTRPSVENLQKIDKNQLDKKIQLVNIDEINVKIKKVIDNMVESNFARPRQNIDEDEKINEDELTESMVILLEQREKNEKADAEEEEIVELFRPFRPGKLCLTRQDFGFKGDFDPIEKLKSELNLTDDNEIIEYIKAVQGEYETAKDIAGKGADSNIHIELPVLSNMIFHGNSGTGKTTVANYMAEAFNRVGLMSAPKTVIRSASDLTGAVVGAANDLVQAAMEEALGGILLIDEAYYLGKPPFGEQAQTKLIAMLEEEKFNKGKVVVVLCGYKKEMQKMMRRNQGMASRFGKEFVFDDMSVQDATKAIIKMLNKEFIHLENDKPLNAFLKKLASLKGWGNYRDCNTIAKDIKKFVYGDSKAKTNAFDTNLRYNITSMKNKEENKKQKEKVLALGLDRENAGLDGENGSDFEPLFLADVKHIIQACGTMWLNRIPYPRDKTKIKEYEEKLREIKRTFKNWTKDGNTFDDDKLNTFDHATVPQSLFPPPPSDIAQLQVVTPYEKIRERQLRVMFKQNKSKLNF